MTCRTATVLLLTATLNGAGSLCGSEPPLKVLYDHPLSEQLSRAQDIRWAGPSSVFLSAGRSGTVELSLEGKAVPRVVVPPLPQAGFRRYNSRLAISSAFVVVAAPARSIFWRSRAGSDPNDVRMEPSFDTIGDLDLREDRLVILGDRRDAQGKVAPDGAIVWVGKVGERLEELKPLMFSQDGPGARSFDACAVLDQGKVRFLSDGSLLVVPGVQSGIFLYDASGKLVHTWQSEGVGLDAGCQVSEQEKYVISAELAPRYQWINRLRVLDEILPLPEGPGLVIRTRSGGQTRWQLKVLKKAGPPPTYDLPFTSDSEYIRLRGDARDGRIAFVLFDLKTEAGNATRLVVTSLPAQPSRPAQKPASE